MAGQRAEQAINGFWIEGKWTDYGYEVTYSKNDEELTMEFVNEKEAKEHFGLI